MYRAGEVSVNRACCELATQLYSFGGRVGGWGGGNDMVQTVLRGVVLVWFLVCVALWFVLRGMPCSVLPCSLLSYPSDFSVPFSKIVYVLLGHVFILHATISVPLLFLYVPGIGYSLWLCQSLDFSINFTTQEKITNSLIYSYSIKWPRRTAEYDCPDELTERKKTIVRINKIKLRIRKIFCYNSICFILLTNHFYLQWENVQ